jgi:L,D-peptidoglycan transpeptidase YkuD (ErfK/YbiS/YcfS/YnhG family)
MLKCDQFCARESKRTLVQLRTLESSREIVTNFMLHMQHKVGSTHGSRPKVSLFPWRVTGQVLGCFSFSVLMLVGPMAHGEGVPQDCTQLIVAVAPAWDSTRGELRLFERSASGDWSAEAGPFPVLFGKNGIAWGTGLAGQNEPGLRKKERDGRAPAGVFEIGKIFGYEANLPGGADYPYHQVTEADVWSDDPRSPNYNRHIVIDPKNPPDNYTHEKMRSGDFAYHWLIEIRHNSDPPIPGAGSAIFFHTRRGVNRPTTGCTTMARTDLLKLITWLRATRHPCYVLLPASEYDRKWRSWNLPSPEILRRVDSSTVAR